MPPSIPWKETSQYKRLTFTVNLGDIDNFEDYDLKQLCKTVKSSYLIAGRETGEGGRKHFQGYMEFNKKRYGKAILKAFRKTFPLPLSVHFEVPYSTAEKNIEYCSKEDKTPFTRGEPTETKENGRRKGLVAAFEMVKKGKPMLEIAEAHPTAWCQYRRSLDNYQAMLAPVRNEPTRSIYLWGPTGTGKTMHAHELDPVTVTWTGQFLNGFRGPEEVLLFDDFDYKKMDWQTFLTITDRYPLTINIKGGFANFAPKTIIFTSNSDPLTWYPDVPAATREAIHRRMNDYGEIRYLGTLVPKEQNILTKYLTKTALPAAAASAAAARVPEPRSHPSPIIIDLTADTDSDDGKSVLSLKRKYTLGKYEKLIIPESDTEETEDFVSPVVNRAELFEPDALNYKE